MAWYSEFARQILPRPTPTPARDKPLASRSLRPRYIFSFRHRPSVYNSARFAGTPRYENCVVVGGDVWVPCVPPPLDSGLRRNDETGRSNGCHLFSYEGMKSRSCGLVQRICTADSATPHPDPCGGQAPALHFLIPPSTIGLQFGTFRRRRAGMEGDWRAHPGSESGTCFRTDRSCRLAPAHQGMKPAWWLVKTFGCRACHSCHPSGFRPSPE